MQALLLADEWPHSPADDSILVTKKQVLYDGKIFSRIGVLGPSEFCARSAPYDGLNGAIGARNGALAT